MLEFKSVRMLKCYVRKSRKSAKFVNYILTFIQAFFLHKLL